MNSIPHTKTILCKIIPRLILLCTLAQGMQRVTIAAREANAVLDRILFATGTANLTGFGTGGPAINGNGEWIELRRMLDAKTRFFRIRRN